MKQFILILSFLSTLVANAQETKLGNATLVYNDSTNDLSFVNNLKETDFIASDIIFADFQF